MTATENFPAGTFNLVNETLLLKGEIYEILKKTETA